MLSNESHGPDRTARRSVLRSFGALGVGAAFAHPALRTFAAETVELPFANGQRELIAYPQKRPLIVLTSRPPQLETPFAVFNDGVLTPNDAFFVRYHWSGVPTSIDPAAFRLNVGGKVNAPLALSLADLKQLGSQEIVAVNQCSGNSRGFFEPRVNGGQLGNGAMGNARWTGVPLKAVLAKAGLQADAVQVTFDGLDKPPTGNGPDFVKSLELDHALDGDVMLAWGNERRRLAALERLSAAPDRAGLLRHLLGQARVGHPSGGPTRSNSSG